jgi:hypothetical protein
MIKAWLRVLTDICLFLVLFSGVIALSLHNAGAARQLQEAEDRRKSLIDGQESEFKLELAPPATGMDDPLSDPALVPDNLPGRYPKHWHRIDPSPPAPPPPVPPDPFLAALPLPPSPC